MNKRKSDKTQSSLSSTKKKVIIDLTNTSSSSKELKGDPIEHLLCAVDQFESPGSFAAGVTLTSMPLPGLYIDKVGYVSFPLTSEQAEKIKHVCEVSQFGRGDEIVQDETYRKSFELDADKIEIRNPAFTNWINTTVLPQIVTKLGLEMIQNRVKANPFKMLLYETGGFFKGHKDTEKEDNMFASMVVVLPSLYSGGELVVEHKDKVKEFSGPLEYGESAYKVKCCAFYSDCTHELKPVTEGWRLCFIYNLVGKFSTSLPTAEDQFTSLENLTGALEAWACSPSALNALVIELEHNYTEDSFCPSTLKGSDIHKMRAFHTGMKHLKKKKKLFGQVLCALRSVEQNGQGYSDAYHEQIDSDDVEEDFTQFYQLDEDEGDADYYDTDDLSQLHQVPPNFLEDAACDGEWKETEPAMGNYPASYSKKYRSAFLYIEKPTSLE